MYVCMYNIRMYISKLITLSSVKLAYGILVENSKHSFFQQFKLICKDGSIIQVFMHPFNMQCPMGYKNYKFRQKYDPGFYFNRNLLFLTTKLQLRTIRVFYRVLFPTVCCIKFYLRMKSSYSEQNSKRILYLFM